MPLNKIEFKSERQNFLMRQIYPVTLTPEAELPGHALGKEEG